MKVANKQKTQFSLIYVLIAAVVLSFVQSWLLAPQTVEIPMSQFLTLVRDGKVDEVSLSDREIRGTLKEGALPASPPRTGDRVRTFLGAEPGPQVFTTTRIPGVDDSTLVKELETHKVKFRGRIETTFWRDLVFGWVIPLGPRGVGDRLGGRSACDCGSHRRFRRRWRPRR